MRIERPTPWGFDDRDPRLELRRAAAEAQRLVDAEETPDADDVMPDDIWSDPEEWELPGGGRATVPPAPAMSRR